MPTKPKLPSSGLKDLREDLNHTKLSFQYFVWRLEQHMPDDSPLVKQAREMRKSLARFIGECETELEEIAEAPKRDEPTL